jgi:hypothetical protein
MQPSSASTAARLAAKASSNLARWPGLAVMDSNYVNHWNELRGGVKVMDGERRI